MLKLFFLFLVLNYNLVFGQNYKIRSKADKIAKYIDDRCVKTDSNKNLAEGISEGESIDGNNGFETYFLKSKVGKELYRIRDYYTIDSTYFNEIYYYTNNKLEKAIINRSKLNIKTNVSYFYFFQGKLIKFIGQKGNEVESNEIFKNSEKFVYKYTNY